MVTSWAFFAALAGALGVILLAPVGLWSVAIFVALFGASYGMISILRPVVTHDVLGGEAFGAKSGELALMYLTASASSAYVGAMVWRAGGYGAMLVALLVLLAFGALFFQMSRRSDPDGENRG